VIDRPPADALPVGPPALVLDTSVVIKWVRQGEVLAEQALALRDAYLDGRFALVVPSLLAYELANILRFKEDLTTESVQGAIESLYDMGLEWIPPSSATISRAVEIARAYETTVYDATFVALAELLGATLVTADERLTRQLPASAPVRFLGEMQ
jgi:predicted nucleic acid-binding protein